MANLTHTLPETELSEYELERHKPMPSKNHGYIQSNLITELNISYRNEFTLLSEVHITMPQKPDCVPDVAVFPKMVIDFEEDELSMTLIPLTAIEILSPMQSDSELVRKINRYFQAGVKSCWLILPGLKAVSVFSAPGVYRFFKDAETLIDTATGIELSLAAIFS